MRMRGALRLGLGLGASTLALVTVFSCMGEDPDLVPDAGKDPLPDSSATPTDTSPPIEEDAGDNPDAATDAQTDAGPPPPDGGIDFAIHMTQNIGSPPLAAVAFDGAGNVVAGVSFNVPTTLGAKSMSPDGGSYDVGVVKLGPSGVPIWMSAFGGSGDDVVQAVAAAANGDIYAVGAFNSATLSSTSLTHRGSGQYDAFLVRLNGATGAVVDAVDLVAATGSGACNSVAVSGTRLVVGCTILGAASVRDSAGSDAARAAIGASNNVFVTMLDRTTLRETWSLSIGGDANDRIAGVALGATGDVYVGGQFESTTLGSSNGAIGIPRKSTGGAGIGDSFALRLAAATGLPLWGKGFGGGDASTNHAFVRAVTVTSTGDMLLAGELLGSVTFGAAVLDTPDGGGGAGDGFIVRLKGADGATSWVTAFGGGAYDTAYSVAPGPEDGVYVGGAYFSTGFKLGGLSLADPLGTTSNLLSARLDSTGKPLWANGITTASASAYVQGSGTASDPDSGAVVFAGTMKGFVNLGDNVPVFSHLDGGGYDFFAVKRRP